MSLTRTDLFAVIRRTSPSLGGYVAWNLRKRRGEMSLVLAEALVREGDLVLDIGAHWGLYSWRFAHLVGPTGRVHAFEPNPTSARSLERLRKRFRNLVVHSVAVSDTSGVGTLHVPQEHGRTFPASGALDLPSARSEQRHERVEVPQRRLDDFDLGSGRPIRFVKCDVEGHERAVIRGGEGILGRELPTLLIEIEQRHQDTDITETFALIGSLGYVGYAIFRDGLRSLEAFDVRRDQLRYLVDGSLGTSPLSRDYVNDFLFTAPGLDVSRWVARAAY